MRAPHLVILGPSRFHEMSRPAKPRANGAGLEAKHTQATYSLGPVAVCCHAFTGAAKCIRTYDPKVLSGVKI